MVNGEWSKYEKSAFIDIYSLFTNQYGTLNLTEHWLLVCPCYILSAAADLTSIHSYFLLSRQKYFMASSLPARMNRSDGRRPLVLNTIGQL